MKNIMDRFWRYVRKTDGCWEWTGAKKKGEEGYGYFLVSAHRFSYELHKGDIEPGKHIHHTCNNPSCVNPEHLEMVTPMENSHEGPHNATKTHCKYGHLYDEENTYWLGRRRYCRACRKRYSSEEAAKRKEERHARGLRWGNPHGGGDREV